MNAFVNDEVAFPQEKFVKYLQNLIAQRLLDNEGTEIKYLHSFNNISIMQKGPNSLKMLKGS